MTFFRNVFSVFIFVPHATNERYKNFRFVKLVFENYQIGFQDKVRP